LIVRNKTEAPAVVWDKKIFTCQSLFADPTSIIALHTRGHGYIRPVNLMIKSCDLQLIMCDKVIIGGRNLIIMQRDLVCNEIGHWPNW